MSARIGIAPGLGPSNRPGRSQVAAGWLKHLSGDRVEIWSAGSEPADQVNPVAVQAMREVGIDISSETPRS